jgi:membrane protease YdiL (CAAX protease family)
MPVTLLAAFGPAIGAVYSLRTLNGKGAVSRYLRGVLDPRFGWKAWLVPILLLGGPTFVAWILPELWGAPRLGAFWPSLRGLPLYFLLMVLIGGGQEELGWRGYILDPMEERLGPFLGNLVLGVIWGIWHLPLFVLPATGQASMQFAGFVLLTVGWSWIFAWVRQASGRRTLAGPYCHGLANASTQIFPTMTMVAGALQTRFWIWVSLTFVVGLAMSALRGRRCDFARTGS